LNTGVLSIARDNTGVNIKSVHGQNERFNEVILTTNFRITSNILEDLSIMEKNIFSGIEYSELKTIIHDDKSNLPTSFFMDGQPVSIVQESHVTTPFKSGDSPSSLHEIFIAGTQNKEDIPVDKNKIYETRYSLLEHLTPDSLIAKSHIQYIQGLKHTWYCGLSTVPVLAEFCLTSGFVIAERLGASYPFASDDKAYVNFESMKKLMFSHEQSLFLLEPKRQTIH
jgi:predicted NAD/FAD-binding protein